MRQEPDRLTLHAVSREVYLSPSHFSRLFVQKVGIHFNDYVLARRIEIAKEVPGTSIHAEFSLTLELWASLFLEGVHSLVEILCSAQEAIHSSLQSDTGTKRDFHRRI